MHVPSRHVVRPRWRIGPTYEKQGSLESDCLANRSRSPSLTMLENIGNTSSKNAFASAPKG